MHFSVIFVLLVIGFSNLTLPVSYSQVRNKCQKCKKDGLSTNKLVVICIQRVTPIRDESAIEASYDVKF
jgi:hypothetical protein